MRNKKPLVVVHCFPKMSMPWRYGSRYTKSKFFFFVCRVFFEQTSVRHAAWIKLIQLGNDNNWRIQLFNLDCSEQSRGTDGWSTLLSSVSCKWIKILTFTCVFTEINIKCCFYWTSGQFKLEFVYVSFIVWV